MLLHGQPDLAHGVLHARRPGGGCCGSNAICGDTFAQRFINDGALKVWEELKEFTLPDVSNAARHAMIDNHLRRELARDPTATVVIVGAGFDTRAFRLVGCSPIAAMRPWPWTRCRAMPSRERLRGPAVPRQVRVGNAAQRVWSVRFGRRTSVASATRAPS